MGLEEHQNPPYWNRYTILPFVIFGVFFDHKIFYRKKDCCHEPREKVLVQEGGHINANNYVNVDGELSFDEEFLEKVYRAVANIFTFE